MSETRTGSTPRRPWLIIGNPDNRRVTMFQDALADAGQPPAVVISYLDLIRDPARLERLPDAPYLVRQDSPGEDFEVERALLHRGYTAARDLTASTIDPSAIDALVPDRGRILYPRQRHLGFLSVLDDLAAAYAAHPRWTPLSPPAAIADLFDKRVTARRYAALDIPVPPYLAYSGADSRHHSAAGDISPTDDTSETSDPAIATPDDLRRVLDARAVTTAYVKLSCGSSASCLAIFGRRGDREHLLTTIEQTPRAWYNNLRLRRITDPARIDQILTFLLREGAQIEARVHKARLGDRFFDCRVVTIADQPRFTVVRQSRHPITNLHLGGSRGDLAALEAAAAPGALDAAMDSCRRVSRAHRCFHLGIDLLFEPGLARHRVIEANAFGDLLPNLTRDGLSVYAWQIREAHRRFD